MNTGRRKKSVATVAPPQGGLLGDYNANTAQYIFNCRRFDLQIDPSVVIALQTEWDILKPTKRFSEGSMLTLMGILDKNDHIKKLHLSSTAMQDSRFRSAGNGNSNARALNQILRDNRVITDVDLSNTGLDDCGIAEICEAIKVNQRITSLNLSYNHFGAEGARFLGEALQVNKTLKLLDLSRNALGFRSIHSLLACACSNPRLVVITSGNYVFEEILNSVSHGIAFVFSIIGANLLIADAADTYRTDYHFWACVAYSFALMFLFLSSSLYHSFFMLPEPFRILQILDHVGIYLVIAGTYTPILLISLHHSTAARVLLCAEWIGAFAGSVFAACSDLNAPMTTFVELLIFITMGMGMLLVWPTLWADLSTETLTLLLLGGGFYIVGIVFFILGEWKPIFHTVWHMFVVVAATIHWFCVYFFILQTSLVSSPTKDAMMAAVGEVVSVYNSTASLIEAATAAANWEGL